MASTAPTPALDNTMGALYIAAIFCTGLWGAASVQLYYYFNNYTKDYWGFKLFVVTVWILDSIHLCLIVIDPYYRLITHYGDPSFLLTKTTPITVEYQYILLSGVVCLMVQGFYVHRVWKLSRRNICLTGFLLALVLAEFSLNTALYAKIMPLATVMGFANLGSLIEGTSALDAIVGLVIAFSMIFYLHRSRTGFRRTESMINRMIMLTVNTGLLTNVFASLCFIFDIIQPASYIHIAFFVCVSKLYTNSLLATLNARYSSESHSLESSEIVESGQSFTRALKFQDARNKELPIIHIRADSGISLTKVSNNDTIEDSIGTETISTIEYAENKARE